MRLRLDLGYDGTDFAGWARQRSGLRTVQALLEEALAVVWRLPGPPATTCAGRTDAGVHARGQVCHVDLAGWSDAGAADSGLRRRLNGVLPDDVVVHGCWLAPAGFDARFSAVARRYVYRIADAAARRDPLRRREVLPYGRRLDEAVMRRAAAGLVGEHDFAAYCRRREGATTVRRLLRADVLRDGDGVLLVEVEADAFCHSMVRSLVGALVAVGEGRRPVEWPAQVLAAGVRDSAVQVMPPYGLTLEQVSYPPDAELAARARAARRVRVLPSP